MLKHVHSSPHRSSSASLKRNLLDEGSPKHTRQTSGPSSFCLSCSSTKDHSKFNLNLANSSLTLEDTQAHSQTLYVTTSFAEESGKSLTSDKDDRELVNLSVCPVPELHCIRCRTVSEPPVICPKCFKKKKKPLKHNENVQQTGQTAALSTTVTENEQQTTTTSSSSSTTTTTTTATTTTTTTTTTTVHHPSFINPNDSLKSSPANKNRSSLCSRHKLNLNTFANGTLNKESSIVPRCSTPIETRQMVKTCQQSREYEENVTSSSSSSPSSPSQSSSSSVTSSKSCYARTKERATKNDDKTFRGRLDNLSLDSSMSCSTSSREDTLCSLSSSAISLPDNLKQTTVRVWVRCLMQEMEYKTICVSYSTTCGQVVKHLLSKFRMKHRDPNLFYLAMEVTIRKAGAEVRTCLRLDDTSFPAQLVECHPKEHSRLALRMRRGGLIRIYDEAVSEGSHYKSLLVGEKISCTEVMSLVLACNKVTENVNNFALVEVWPKEGKERILGPEDEPMVIASEWEDREAVRFEIRRTSNSTNRNSSLNDVIDEAPPIFAPSNDAENENKNKVCGNQVKTSITDNSNFESKGTQNNFDEEKNCDSNFEVSDSSSLSSECPSSPSISSSPLHSKSNANILIENKYLSKLKGKSDQNNCSTISRGQTKSRRKRLCDGGDLQLYVESEHPWVATSSEREGRSPIQTHNQHGERLFIDLSRDRTYELPKPPDYSSKLAKSLSPNENQKGDDACLQKKKIEFKTYNDYENYFYI